mgnify:FL=1
MSEYQYYEFQAIDRPLTGEETGELRSVSTRARITPTSFVNEYAWGRFKGDEDAWMEKYFDAFLYLANWGTRVLKLRLPSRLLDVKAAEKYVAGDSTFVREKSAIFSGPPGRTPRRDGESRPGRAPGRMRAANKKPWLPGKSTSTGSPAAN